ncbi:hypothetical protein QL285_085144 [Trifolium repens]|jgi:hypothetical protein|nr:hypothetical protein QL285_085144 [Trifolium repens]
MSHFITVTKSTEVQELFNLNNTLPKRHKNLSNQLNNKNNKTEAGEIYYNTLKAVRKLQENKPACQMSRESKMIDSKLSVTKEMQHNEILFRTESSLWENQIVGGQTFLEWP